MGGCVFFWVWGGFFHILSFRWLGLNWLKVRHEKLYFISDQGITRVCNYLSVEINKSLLQGVGVWGEAMRHPAHGPRSLLQIQPMAAHCNCPIDCLWSPIAYGRRQRVTSSSAVCL